MRGLAGIPREELEDLLFQCQQGEYLEEGLRRADTPALAGATREIDPRGIVIARAMRRTRDGKGDLCYPGPLAPGPALAFGATPLEYLRHLARTRTSPASARSGGDSWTDLRRGIVGWSGRPGMMTQVVAGAALAFARRDAGRAGLVFESPAALESGGWHEGMSFAAARRAPVLVVLAGRAERRPTTGSIAKAYGIRRVHAPVGSLASLFRVASEARRRMAGEGGPALMELGPLAGARHRALLARFREQILNERILVASEIDAIARTALAGVSHAFARIPREGSPEPDDALVAVRTGSAPLRPWTRMRSPSPEGLRVEPKKPGATHVH